MYLSWNLVSAENYLGKEVFFDKLGPRGTPVVWYYLSNPWNCCQTMAVTLMWVAKNKGGNSMITRWFLTFQDITFTVVYRTESIHRNVETLSWVYCHIFLCDQFQASWPLPRNCMGEIYGESTWGQGKEEFIFWKADTSPAALSINWWAQRDNIVCVKRTVVGIIDPHEQSNI